MLRTTHTALRIIFSLLVIVTNAGFSAKPVILEQGQATTEPDVAESSTKPENPAALMPFGYGLTVAEHDSETVQKIGFNWMSTFDVPAYRHPVNVMYRVKADKLHADSPGDLYGQLRGTILRFGFYIDAYEIGNEVNLSTNGWEAPPDALEYVSYLCAAYRAIKEYDGSAIVVSAGLAPVGRVSGVWRGYQGHDGTRQDEREFLRDFFRAGGGHCTDVIGYHPLGFSANFDAIPDVNGGTPESNCENGFCFRGAEKMYAIMQEFGFGHEKIWATEMGWLAEPEAAACLQDPTWQGRVWQRVSPAKQAENLVGAFRYASEHWPWMRAMFVFNLNFSQAPWYHDCEQMRYYSVQNTVAETALHQLHPNDPLTLLYAVLDNNLGDGWTRLVNNAEAGVSAGMKARLLLDGPGSNDVYLYDLLQDKNPLCPNPTNLTCDGRYTEGSNFWHIANENSANPEALYQFIVAGLGTYSTTRHVTLSLIGHGSGWSANVLPGQPSIWRGQNDTLGGMLWDDHPGSDLNESRSLSTRALAEALQWATKQTGKSIDLLYLDGCSMGMIEVAYELRNSARFLLASPNIDWASFNYDTLLAETVNLQGATLGERWLNLEAAEFRANPGHPFTLSLIDLSKVNAVAAAASGLAETLRTDLVNQRLALRNAFTNTDHFDSDYNGVLNTSDAYSDLSDFAFQLTTVITNDIAINNAVSGLRHLITQAVIAKDVQGGVPWVFAEQEWQWKNFGGLGVYLPVGKDEERRRIYYNGSNLAWAADTAWDELLADFWSGTLVEAGEVAAMPVCRRTTDGCNGLANPLPVDPNVQTKLFYLPMIHK